MTTRTVTLVIGPVGAGKTTWALRQMRRGDYLVDGDRLLAALQPPGEPLWDARGSALRRWLVTAVTAYLGGVSTLYLTAGGATRREREAAWLTTCWQPQSTRRRLVIVLPPDAETALARIRTDVASGQRPRTTRREVWEQMARGWYGRLQWPDADEADEIDVISSTAP